MAVAGALAVPGVANAESLAHRDNHLRAEVVGALGSRAPGRDIVRHGILGRHGQTRRPTHAELIGYRDALARMLAATAPAPTSTSAGSSSVDSTSDATTSGDLPTCTWEPESGGDWHAVNPSSGAGGRYQIMPSTWAEYGGTGLPQDASPAEQTAIAERIMQSVGPSAWANC
jgi:Transglycosylase-like domain